jgi:benzil reductase ((S)-benzoin forming)
MTLFISGVSSGIGLALAKKYLDLGAEVYGLSRRPCPDARVKWTQCDLADSASIKSTIIQLLADVKDCDLAILNAGLLGTIQDLSDAKIEELKTIMDVNLWANKILIDVLCGTKPCGQVITLSSGAAVNGNRGWSAYSLSKAALNMMTQLYAKEFTKTHFCAFAPGLVDTAMQDQLCSIKELGDFKSLERIQAARGTESMPSPSELANQLPSLFKELLEHPSGSFIDIRKMN